VLRSVPGERVELIATGSEVSLALAAARRLADEGIAARVVSAPCLELFERQDAAYRRSVIPRGLPRLAIEAGRSGLWWKYVGEDGDVVALERFGESAPAPALFEHFGFTPQAVAARARGLLG
jgi:transketolase